MEWSGMEWKLSMFRGKRKYTLNWQSINPNSSTLHSAILKLPSMVHIKKGLFTGQNYGQFLQKLSINGQAILSIRNLLATWYIEDTFYFWRKYQIYFIERVENISNFTSVSYEWNFWNFKHMRWNIFGIYRKKNYISFLFSAQWETT